MRLRVLMGALLVAAGVAARAATAAAQPAPAAGDAPGAAGTTYSGRDQQLTVVLPRLDESAVIDGSLDEPVWQRAVVLSGFSKYLPVDGAAADLRTEVLVWYAPTAIYFGVRAEAPPGSVRATLADRDRLDTDDQIVFFLSTFNDSRQAFVFAVNPLGVQADGALVEGTTSQRQAFGGLTSGRESPDLSPDFVFQSRGRLTDAGFEIEVRIPFKSLRYQSVDPQDWGFNVTRVLAGEGREESWAPARRDEASFLGQSGSLTGLTDLRRGLVLDLNPFVTARADGSEVDRAWQYDTETPDVGINVRWGVTSNLTLNGTLHPDFSQVESDAGQFQFDPRQALYYPEKRPFFLDAIEQFATPNRLIYTRRIVAPEGAAKLTGKVTPTSSLAVLSAVDDQSFSLTREDHPVFTIVRLQQDVGRQSKLGVVYTDRVAGQDSNRVAGVDTRLVLGDIYALQAQGAVSRTDVAGTLTTAPLWEVAATRTGRRYGFRYSARGVDDQFRAAAGFIERAGIATIQLTNQAIFPGRPTARLERFTSDVALTGRWQYEDFTAGGSAQDRQLHWNNNVTLRGGWQFGGSILVETFGFDEDLYRDYALIDTVDGQPVLRPFVGTPSLPNLDYVVSWGTPQRAGVTLDGFLLWGKDENFYEWASADILFASFGLLWRPTERLRVDGRYQLQSFQRRTDQSYVAIRRIPRLKAEYQMTRAIFLRFVGEYDGQFVDDLRDDSRTNLPIAIRDAATGEFVRALRTETQLLRLDALFSYQPTPGTVVFVGYGNSMAELDDGPARRLQRTRDGFFLKLSYLFRL